MNELDPMTHNFEPAIAGAVEGGTITQDKANPNELMKKMDRALQFGDEQDLMGLFDEGIDVDQTDFQGRTALMMCTAQGKRTVVEALVERGADVNFIYNHQDRIPNTALDAATQTGQSEIADLLREQGAMGARELIKTINEARENNAEFLNLRSVQFTNALAEAPVYRKNTIVQARPAQAGEVVVTVTPAGVEEGRNTAGEGDFVVTGANGADFILPGEKFNKLYEATENGTFRSRGMARIIDNPTGEKIGILAPWGEMQYGDAQSKIAVQFDPQNADIVGADRYILDVNEFAAYTPLEEIV